MTFTILDIILIVILLIFVIMGFVLGLIQAIGGLVGVVFGAWTASRYFMPFADWLTPILLGRGLAAKIVAFIVIFIAINRLVGFLFYLLDRAFRIISILPFLKSINRLGGLLLGLLEGVLVLGLIIYVIAKFAPDVAWVADALKGSMVAHWLVYVASVLNAFLPQAFEKMKSVI